MSAARRGVLAALQAEIADAGPASWAPAMKGWQVTRQRNGRRVLFTRDGEAAAGDVRERVQVKIDASPPPELPLGLVEHGSCDRLFAVVSVTRFRPADVAPGAGRCLTGYLWFNLDNERLYIQQLFSHDASLDDDVSRNLAYQGPQTLPKAAVALMFEKLADRGIDKAFFLRAVGVVREAEEAGYRHWLQSAAHIVAA
ncbi:hypothetical protein DIPPA_13051 [Diplonema papillatum]|nr:hypothetical protein DIPPA_13051 [Diplonema papillatum]